MDANETKTFEKCPQCGGKERFFENLGKAVKGRGLAPANALFAYQVDAEKIPIPPQMVERLPIGSELPAYSVATDICTGCGTVYAVLLRRFSVKRPLVIGGLPHGMVLPGTNDPRFS